MTASSAAYDSAICLILHQACMQDAAASFSDDKHLRLELHARLLHIAQKLRRVPEDVEDAELHTGSIKGRKRPPGVAELAEPAKPKVERLPLTLISVLNSQCLLHA